MILHSVESAFLCQKYVIPQAQTNSRCQDCALLNSADVFDNQSAFFFFFFFVSAGLSTRKQSLYISLESFFDPRIRKP